DEPSPSGIIYKDPSAHEIVLPPTPPVAAPAVTDAAAQRKGPGSSFILPPELEATRPADADVPLQQPGIGSGQRGEARSDSSRIDLEGDGRHAPSSGSLGR